MATLGPLAGSAFRNQLVARIRRGVPFRTVVISGKKQRQRDLDLSGIYLGRDRASHLHPTTNTTAAACTHFTRGPRSSNDYLAC